MSGNHVVNFLITYANNYVIGNNKKIINKDITLSFSENKPSDILENDAGKGLHNAKQNIGEKKIPKSKA